MRLYELAEKARTAMPPYSHMTFQKILSSLDNMQLSVSDQI